MKPNGGVLDPLWRVQPRWHSRVTQPRTRIWPQIAQKVICGPWFVYLTLRPAFKSQGACMLILNAMSHWVAITRRRQDQIVMSVVMTNWFRWRSLEKMWSTPAPATAAAADDCVDDGSDDRDDALRKCELHLLLLLLMMIKLMITNDDRDDRDDA